MCQIGAKIWMVLFVIGTFLLFVTQHFLGYFTGCIAIKAYSYHVLSDTFSLCVGLVSYMVRHSPDTTSVNSDDENCRAPVRNTYGWARVELVGSLIGHVSIIALCFSCALDSLQFLVQPDFRLHYHCRMMLAMGGLGIVVHLSVIFYSLMFRCCISNPGASMPGLASTQSEVANETHMDALSVQKPISVSNYNSMCLTFLHEIITNEKRDHQVDLRAMLRHIGIGLLSATMIVIDALVHFFIDHHEHKWIHYIDPFLAIIIIGVNIGNIVPLIVQNGFVLILNTPEDVDVVALQRQLMNEIPQIAQVHDIHIWRLEGKKIIATIHAVFEEIDDEQHFTNLSKQMTACFHKWDIHSLTFQPEFQSPIAKLPSIQAEGSNLELQTHQSNLVVRDCLYKCSSTKCAKDTCCRSHSDRCLTRSANNLTQQMKSQTHVIDCRNMDLNEETEEGEVREHLIAGVV